MRLILLSFWMGSFAYGASSYLAFTSDYPSHFPVAGFEWHSRFEFFRVFDGERKSHSLRYGGRDYEIHWDAERLRVSVHSNQFENVSLSLDSIESRARTYLKQHGGTQVPQSLLTEVKVTETGKALFYVEALSIEHSGEGRKVLHLKGDLLYSSETKARSNGRK
jgi:hypothetical protein